MSVNNEFRDYLLRRSHYLYRFENGAIRDMLGPMRRAENEMNRKLMELTTTGTGYTKEWRIQRLNQQIAESQALWQAANFDAAGVLQERMYETALAEGASLERMLSAQYGKIGADIKGLPFLHIDYIINNPLLAEDIGSKLARASDSALNRVRGELTQSIIQGEDIAKATNRLVPIVGQSFTNPAYAPTRLIQGSLPRTIKDRAEMIARSEILYTSNQVARNIYQNNTDVLQGVMYTATLDRRTCLICATSDGKIYKFKDGEDHNGPLLPRHPRCRCTYSPLTKSWAQLEKENQVKPGVSQKTKGGFVNTAPDVVTYGQWLKTQPAEVVKDILGPTRYKMWSAGELQLSEMATSKRIYSLAELNQKSIVKPKVKKKSVKKGKPVYARVDALSQTQLERMTAKQVKAWEEFSTDTYKTRKFGELVEGETATKLGADHIIGRKPFDMFFENEFIEHKVLFSGRGQIRMKADAIKRKNDFVKRYNVRPHTVVVDRRPGSPTYGKYFYRKGLGDFSPQTMTEVKDFDHLKRLLLKGKKRETLSEAIVKVPKSSTTEVAEVWAKKKYKLEVVDYGKIDPKVGDIINKHLGGSIEQLGVKPKGIFVDEGVFVGKNKNAVAMAFEDGSLYFNPRAFNSAEKLRDIMEYNFKIGQFSTMSEGHLIKHEMGHLKYFNMGGTEKTSALKLTKTMLKDLQKGVGDENLKRYVSAYARKSQGEFYAEMTAKTLNGERLHPAVKKIMQDMEKALKKLSVNKTVERQALQYKNLKYNTSGEQSVNEFIKQRDKLPSDLKSFVTSYTEKEYKEMGAKVFLSADGKSGYALTKEKDLILVFSHPGAKQGKLAIMDAIKNGAKTLDCFDAKQFNLPTLYGKFGFKEYKRLKWNTKYTPDGWDYKKYDNPDVVMMRKQAKGVAAKAKEVKFTPAKTIDEAIEKLSKAIGTKANRMTFNGIDLDVVNEMTEEIIKLNKKFGIRPQDIRTYKKRDNIFAGFSSGTIKINTNYLGSNKAYKKAFLNIEKKASESIKLLEKIKKQGVPDNMKRQFEELKKTVEELKKYDRILYGNSIKDVISHEVGHAIHNGWHLERGAVKDKWIEKVRTVTAKVFKDDKKYQYQLSHYSSTLYRDKFPQAEFFAESFAAYADGNVKIVHPLMRELFEEVERAVKK